MADASSSLPPQALARYARQIQLDEIGLAGQERLTGAAVLVIGAGGLGSPAALYLAAAGVGTIGIADFDQVEEHNLQRQLLHDTTTIGAPKVASAAARLRALNPLVRVVEHPAGITPANAVATFTGYDVVIDGTDNFGARYMNNDAAFLARKPLVHGSVFKFEGQVTVFAPGGPCYRCLFPQPPAPGSVPGCGEAGVVGALCGVIGSMQALEAIKLITRAGTPLVGRLLTYDALQQSFSTLQLRRDPACPLCGTAPSIVAVDPARDRGAAGTAPAAGPRSAELSVSEARALWEAAGTDAVLLDVREPWETNLCRLPRSTLIPMREVPERRAEIPRDRPVLVLCHHGARSRRITEWLRANGYPDATNIAGGIAAWAEQIDPSLRRY